MGFFKEMFCVTPGGQAQLVRFLFFNLTRLSMRDYNKDHIVGPKFGDDGNGTHP